MQQFTSKTKRLALAAAVGSILFLTGMPSALAAEAKNEANELAQFYGFTGVELYKLDDRAFNLTVGDFDSDGLRDIVAVDNRASCLRLFRQRSSAEEQQDDVSADVNEIRFDTRFATRQIPVDKLVAGLTSGDFNNDGRTDIAFVGAPDRLIVRFQPAAGVTDWTERASVRLPDLQAAAWMIAAGDFNGDSLTDVAVLGSKAIYVVHQKSDGTLDTPESLINTSSKLALLQAADLNGDGRTDLSYRASEGSTNGLCARLQTKEGRLGPEVRLDLAQPRSVTLGELDGKPGAEVLTIDERTGRVVASQLRLNRQSDANVPERLVRFGIGDTSSSQTRAVAVGDIDGDKQADVIITDAENAQMLVYRQNGTDGLETAEAYPGLLGATDVCLVDTNQDGTNEVVVMSPQEALIGISRFEEGRLTFPTPVARIPDDFTADAIQILRGTNGPELVLVSHKGSGSSRKVNLHRYTVSPSDQWQPTSAAQELPGETVGSRGVQVLPFNAETSGPQQALIIPNGAGNKGITLLRRQANEEIAAPVDLGTTSAAQIFVHDGALFAARESFARKLIRKNDQWAVSDQFNAGESRARIAGVAVLNLDGRDDEEVVLVDTGIKKLRILRRSDGLYRPWKEVDLGVLRYSASHVADLNNDGRNDLLLVGLQQFAVLYAGTVATDLQELASFDSDRDESYPADVIVGDINSDDSPDLVVIDNKLNGIEILHHNPTKGLRSATRFRVFEEKRLVTESSSRGTQPREAVIADVTGDDRSDLILLCHDRLIVYPQDSGQEQK